MNVKFMITLIKAVLIVIVSPIATGFAVSFLWGWFNDINPKKIYLYLPYAYEYKFPDGKTYKDSSPSVDKSSKQIDDKTPIPVVVNEEIKLTIGIENTNKKSLQNVVLHLTIPDGIQITKYEKRIWTDYQENQYYARLNDVINNGVGVNITEPLYIKIKKVGIYKIIYHISGVNIKKIERVIPIIAYSTIK